MRTKNDNSYLNEKVKLRESYLTKEKKYKVLDMFHGKGKIWNQIKKDGYQCEITSIDIKKGLDNRKLNGFVNFEDYDVIDFDSYGDGLERMLCYISEIKTGTIVFITLISILNKLSNKTLKAAGINPEIVRTCPTILDNEIRIEIVKTILQKYTDSFRIYKPTAYKFYLGYTKTK